MTTGQTISIVSAVIVSAAMVSVSVIMNTPTTPSVPSGDTGNVKDGKPASRTETRKWNLKQIIESI